MIKSDGINPGGTHFPILAAALERSGTLPVVECGIGDYSTPMLHLLCKRLGRPLASLESHAEWLEEFKKLYARDPWHFFIHVPDWAELEIDDTIEYGVAFIDLAPGELRPVVAKKFANNAKYIVCHDTEAYGDGWAKIEGVFRYATVWREYPTWTTVYSNFEKFEL